MTDTTPEHHLGPSGPAEVIEMTGNPDGTIRIVATRGNLRSIIHAATDVQLTADGLTYTATAVGAADTIGIYEYDLIIDEPSPTS